MRRAVAVVETPLLAGQGLAAWLAAQPGFAAWVAADWGDTAEADVVLIDLSRGEPHAQSWLEEAPRRPQPLVAIESPAHPLPERWRSWLGTDRLLTVPVAAESLLASLAAASPLPPDQEYQEQEADWLHAPFSEWDGSWDGVYFQAAAESETTPDLPLTRREKEIARLVSLGLSNREIGERLFVAVGTVRKHRENLMTKLEIRSARALTQWALAAGLISREEFASCTHTDRR